MRIKSPAFQSGQPIPTKYTCKGVNVSPELDFVDAPLETVTFAIIMDDPDAPNGTFDHWIGWNIPGNVKGLKEDAAIKAQGTNGFGEQRYQGPCPPPGKAHRYFFKLYALDTDLTLPEGSSKSDLEQAMEGSIIAKAELMGLFQRS